MANVYKKKKSFVKGPLITAILFTGILILFLTATSFITEGDDRQQREALQKAIDSSLLQCYCIEGRYPPNFDYLANNYGILYDKKKYRVDYTVFGTNMKPEIFIIDLGNANE